MKTQRLFWSEVFAVVVMDNLMSLSKQQLVKLIESLKNENDMLKDLNKTIVNNGSRLEKLEREQNLHFQYQRRDTVEITGIPQNVHQDNLEDEVIKIFDAMEVKVNGNQLSKIQIHACHRIGKKNVVIVKVVNRKFATKALYSGSKLKDVNMYGNSKIYVNNSFCREFQFFNFLIRKASKAKIINRYKIKHGVMFVQQVIDGDFHKISHKNDLIKLGIDVPTESPDN